MNTNIPFRIRIGVTGHRRLPDKDKLSEKISQVLNEFIEVINTIKNKEKLTEKSQGLEKDLFDLFDGDSKKAILSSPNTPIAFSILTPLAEGADRLVPQVAQDVLKCSDLKIEVVLPLAKGDYLQDKSSESRQEFKELYEKARRPITLKKHTLQEGFSEDNLKEARQQAYEDVGRYVVNHCDVLIALWDGEPSRGKGSTAEIVEYAKKRKRPAIIISTITPYKISILKGHGLYAESLKQIEIFNTFPIQESEQQKYITNTYSSLFNNPEGEKIPEESRELVKDKLLPFYARASMIAEYNQKLYRYAGSFVYSLSSAAIAFVALGILIRRLSPYAFFLEFLLLATILFMVTYANRRKTHKKWIESRFLTERIRSSCFFVTCGVEVSPIDIPPYMRTAHQPDDWMVKVFNEIRNRLPVMKGCHEKYCPQYIEFIKIHWIEDQKNFHEDKATKTKRMSKLLEWSGISIFSVAMVVAISHVISHFYGHELQSSGLNNVLIFFAVVLPAVGAAIGGIRSHREYSRLEKRSKNMEVALTDLNERLSQISTPEDLESLLRETDELMLRETQDWLMLMRFVKLEAVP